MKVNEPIWAETQSLIEGGIFTISIVTYLAVMGLIGIPLYIIVGVIRKIKPKSNDSDSVGEGGDLNWKKMILGNPFKKESTNESFSTSSNEIEASDLFGVPKESKKDSSKKDLSTKIFESRQAAGDTIAQELRKAYYQEIFYTITVRCPNCRIQGVVRLERGQAADRAECPRCEVEGLQVLGVGSNKEEDIINSPRLDEETEKTIEGQVSDAVEHAWSIGRIKREGIFE